MVIFSFYTVVGEPVTKSDIHLIMEYDKGETWGQYQATRANRYW